MMSVPVRVLTQYLLDKTDQVLSSAMAFQALTFEQLCQHPQKNSWSIAECLQHLNLYGDYYLPQISAAFIDENKWQSLDTTFKSGWLGDYLANQVLPQEGKKLVKMRSPDHMKPKLSTIHEDIVTQFIEQQKNYKEIILRVDKYNLNKRAIRLSIMPIMRVNIGDILRFCVHHNIRHIEQAQRAYAAIVK